MKSIKSYFGGIERETIVKHDIPKNYKCKYVCIDVFMDLCFYVLFIYLCNYVFMSLCFYLFIYVIMFLCLYVFIYFYLISLSRPPKIHCQ